MSENEQVDELDTEEFTDEISDVEETNDDDTPSDRQITWDEVDTLRERSKSLDKSNYKIVQLNKEIKRLTANPSAPSTQNLSEDELDLFLEKRDFYKSNTNAKALKEEIEAMVTASKGKVDRDKAYSMLSWDEEIEENRKVYSKGTVVWNKSVTSVFNAIDTAKYDKLSNTDRDAYDAKSMKAKGYIDLK